MIKFSACLFTFLFLSLSTTLHAADLQPRIIGGNDADAGEWPATVALLFTDDYDAALTAGYTVGEAQFLAQFCGGTLLAPNWVLTAAHCVHDINNQLLPAAGFSVLAGVTNLLNDGQLRMVTNVIVHPDYSAAVFDSDIALLELANDTVAPAGKIPLYQGDPAVGSDATVVGWGDMTNGTGDFPEILQEAVVQIVSTADCNTATAFNGAITDNMLCAAATGKDGCGGDSGGPLMAMQNGEFRQVGIVSFGNQCALPDYPGVYTRVDRFSAWINDIINLPPIADPQTIAIDEDTVVSITLSGSDPDGVLLSYRVLTQPGNGVLTGTAPELTYTPNTNFNGDDSFTFMVNDGVHDSAPATVSITVSGFNDAPTADSQSITTDEDTAALITLSGSDPEGDSLAYVVVNQPANGVLSGTSSALTYTPSPGFSGNDSFTFLVNDGSLDSAPATVSILVSSVNDKPTANSQSITTDEDMSIVVNLTGSDQDGDSLNYTVLTQPANGVLTGTVPALTYIPNTDYNGNDSFTFLVNDGVHDSAPVTVSIVVNGVNDAPAANPQSIATDEDTAVLITLNGSDLDGDSLSYRVMTQPLNGVLTGAAPALTYTPNPGYSGNDSFTFLVNDSSFDSTAAMVTITVRDSRAAPSSGGGGAMIWLLLPMMLFASRRFS